jgi:nucleotide-binding universal stress UspA family protein
LIVGVDGSDGARQAVAWAAEEAGLRGDTLTMVTVLNDAELVSGVGFTSKARRRLEQATIERSEALLEDLARQVPTAVPSVRSEVLLGSPAEVLLTRAAGPSGLVVGSRGRGGFAGLLLGSVSQQVTVHATCPVIVVPGERTPQPDGSRPSDGVGAVVVGVDGSQHARNALWRAAEEASLRGARLDVVIVSSLPPAPPGVMEELALEATSSAVWTDTPSLAGLELSRQLRTEHARALGEWRAEVQRAVDDDLGALEAEARAPEYKVHLVTDAHPAEALMEVARGADLLVVGSRGYGGFAAMLAGSVSQQCVRHAPVPVLVMPA